MQVLFWPRKWYKALRKEANPAKSEVVRVRIGFFSPNGGSYAIPEVSDPGQGPFTINLDTYKTDNQGQFFMDIVSDPFTVL